MYQFPEELREKYESMRIPFIAFQFLDGKMVPLLVSDGLCDQLDHMPREKIIRLLQEGLYDSIHPDDVGRVASVSRSFASHESGYNVFFRRKHPDGYHAVHGVGYWQTMPGGTEIALLTYQDLNFAEEELRKASEEYDVFRKDYFFRDPLTGLPNTNYMQEFADDRIHALRVNGKDPVLIYSDVDSMQFYNNQYGFARGNDLLCLIAETLQKHFPENTLLARGSDDHFVLIGAYEGEEDIARRIAAVNLDIRTGAQGNTTGIQAGVVVLANGMSFSEGIDHAKNAIKRIGSDMNRSYEVYSRQADVQYWNQRYIVENLDRALEERWIRVFYQGIVRVQTEKTACFEALARWNDPGRGTISREDFIPVLEKYHLLYKLDLYMVKQVCLELKDRHDAGLPLLPVSVNFAAQDFEYRDIPEEIEALYHSTGADRLIPRSFLVLEITERDMALAGSRFHEQLRKLRSLGYRLWLDDFGSGYSSLNILSRFEVDLIKFDMALVQHLDERNGINREIIRAMISIVRTMGIDTLAEGVETDAQKEFLRSVNCNFAQGFLFRRPVSLDSVLYIVRSASYIHPCETDEERRDFRIAAAAPALQGE